MNGYRQLLSIKRIIYWPDTETGTESISCNHPIPSTSEVPNVNLFSAMILENEQRRALFLDWKAGKISWSDFEKQEEKIAIEIVGRIKRFNRQYFHTEGSERLQDGGGGDV
jgi:hypothetical protein